MSPGRLAGVVILGVYGVALELITWIALVPWELLHAPGRGLAPLRQRLGRPPAGVGPVLAVVHGAAAGEATAAATLALELGRDRDVADTVVVTANRREGLVAARRILTARAAPPTLQPMLLPWDRPAAMARWLDALRPRVVVLVETELWPGLLVACHRRRIPVCVASGRLDPGIARRYRLAGPLVGALLEPIAWVGARTSADRDAFIGLGARAERVVVTGDLKRDVAAAPPVRGDWSTAAGTRTIVAGSTHAPEERWLIDAVARHDGSEPRPRLVLAPRRVARARAVARMARRAGLVVERWSRPVAARRADWQVLVIDVMGPLAAAYRHADVAVLGGTIASCGGHNVEEALAAEVPLVAGVHTANVRDAVSALRRLDAIVEVAEPAGLRRALAALVVDDDTRSAIRARLARWRRARPPVAAPTAREIRRVAGLPASSPDVSLEAARPVPPARAG